MDHNRYKLRLIPHQFEFYVALEKIFLPLVVVLLGFLVDTLTRIEIIL